MADYSALIDAQTWAFIRDTEIWCPPDATDQSIRGKRQRYDAMCRHFFSPYPGKVGARDMDADGVPIRLYHRVDGLIGVTVLYGHGGALMLGGLESHDDICAEICDATGFDVIAVDYRLNPEFSRQDALDDFETALAWLRQDRGGSIVCVGDSSGGFLCAALVHGNRDMGDIAGQVLIYPGLSFDQDGGSMKEHAFAPLLSRADILQYREILRGRDGPGSGSGPAALGDDFSGLPVTVAMSAECDPIADDGRTYVDAINAAGGRAFWFLDRGLVHGHLRARHRVNRARASFGRVVRAISLIGAGRCISGADISA